MDLIFRAWDGARMLAVGQIDFAIDLGPSYWITTPEGEHLNIPAENIMQFTGLRDKSGNRIFEGDIVRMEYPKGAMTGHEIGAISFREANATWRFAAWLLGSTVDYTGTKNLEVIGNIHQSPELAPKS